MSMETERVWLGRRGQMHAMDQDVDVDVDEDVPTQVLGQVLVVQIQILYRMRRDGWMGWDGMCELR